MVTILTMIICCILLMLAVLVDIVLCIPVALIIGAFYGVWKLAQWLVEKMRE